MTIRVPSDSMLLIAAGTSLRTGSRKAKMPINSIFSISETEVITADFLPIAINLFPSSLALIIHDSILLYVEASILDLESKISGAPIIIERLPSIETENLYEELNGIEI